MMTDGLVSWWYFLCAVGAFNVVAWAWSAAALGRRRGMLSRDAHRTRRLQLFLSAVYVAGCAFRSALPVYDVPRLCLVDTWLSSVLIGRSVATVAELCFVAQWAVMLHEVSRAAGSRLGRMTAFAVVPLIAVAETCSWYSVLTTSNIGHVAEESIWGFTALLLVVSALFLLPAMSARRRPLIVLWCLAGAAYVAFMFTVDVPMYWARWVTDQAVAHRYLTLGQGFTDVMNRRIVSHRWEDWQNEIAWMSLYFSVAVWISMSFIHAPPPRPASDDRRMPVPRAAASGAGA